MILASDTHLAGADPDGIRRFLRFLEGPASTAGRVILAGDLFDFWVTSDQAADPELEPVLRGLASLVASGVEVGFVEGNRDFAASPDLRALGVARLPDVTLLESGGRRVVVTHGDRLCTRDVPYQAFRRVVRSGIVRHLLRRVPASLALGAGRRARQGSALETSRKRYDDMALVPLAVAALLRQYEADALVCGHVHWGQRFRLDVDGIDRDIVVLSSWEARGSYARLEAGRLDFFAFE